VRERVRYKRFKKEVCTTCLVHKPCNDNYDYDDRRGCRGPYDISEEKATAQILSEHEIPYTDEFLAALLGFHCGKLPFRVNRKTAHLSCEIAPMDNVLKFGVVYSAQGYFEALELSDLQDIVGRLRERSRPPVLLTQHEKAILIELAHRHRSPRENWHWHRTRYRSLYIDFTGAELQLHFRYNCHSREQDRGWELPYSVSARCLGDIYKNYQNLRTLQKTDHPFRKVYKQIFRG
jgi:hypothetical protein